MADPFVAEIRIFPFTFPPKGWAFCNGQILPISQNTALFSLLGTYYGGDGRSTFALPNLQGAAPMGTGTGLGLSPRVIGEAGGSATTTLLQSEVPVHTHGLRASPDGGDNIVPAPATSLAGSTGGSAYAGGSPVTGAMSPQALAPAGSGAPHNNMQPYLTLNFNIALQGVYPPRS